MPTCISPAPECVVRRKQCNLPCTAFEALAGNIFSKQCHHEEIWSILVCEESMKWRTENPLSRIWDILQSSAFLILHSFSLPNILSLISSIHNPHSIVLILKYSFQVSFYNKQNINMVYNSKSVKKKLCLLLSSAVSRLLNWTCTSSPTYIPFPVCPISLF